MLIDWFTVGAQIVNFLILVWLLKRFLYRPILNAIDAREKRIADRLKAAEVEKETARCEREELQRQAQELEQKRAVLLKEAVTQANAERQNLLQSARKEAEAARSQWKQSLHAEQVALQHELATRTQQEVFAISRKVLADLATQPIEECVAEIFLKKLRELNGDAKGRLIAALQTRRHDVMVRSAFQLSNSIQIELGRVVRQMVGAEIQVRYNIAPQLICGIELQVGGEKVAWSIADYLGSLEQTVAESTAPQEAANAGRN